MKTIHLTNMQPEERKAYINLLRILKKITKKGELQELINNLDHSAIDKICRCLFNVVYHENCRPKNSKKRKSLRKLMLKNRDSVEFLTNYSPSTKKIEEKRKILQSGGFPLLPILSAVIPTLISLFTK